MGAGQTEGASVTGVRVALEVRVVEPDVIVAPPTVAVPGRPVGAGWGGLGARFARYWLAATISLYGDWFSTVALVVLLYRLSGPAAPAGYMVARVLPRLLSGTVGGALSDRVQPHQLIALCALIQGALTASIVPASRIGAVWAVYGAVAIAQAAGGIARPAIGAMIPRVAPAQRLQRANALASLGLSSSIAVGPALAAPLLALGGVDMLLILDALSFAVAALLMMTLGVRRMDPWSPVTRGVTVGIRAVWRDPELRSMGAAWLSSAVSVTAASSVLVLIARGFGHSDWVGYLYAAVGAGSVLLGFGVLRFRPKVTTREIVVAVAVLEVLALALVTVDGPFWSALLALGVSGGAGIVWQTWGTTDMQMRSHPAFLGRINAVMVVAASAGMLLGAVLALALVPWAGWERTLFVACCLSLVILAAGVVFGPQRRTAPN
jgi:hypothetical protein